MPRAGSVVDDRQSSGPDPAARDRSAASPELTAPLDEQGRAVHLTRCARPAAPPALRAEAEATRAAGSPHARRAPGLAIAGLGVLGLALVALGPGSAPHPASVTAVAALATRGVAAPAPTADTGHQGALRSAFQGVRFPYLQGAFGWRSTGARADLVGGRPAMTVFYTSAAPASVAYTIVGGRPLPAPRGAHVQPGAGLRFVGLHAGRRVILTWQRAGHTCVISGVGVPLGTLLRLAQWPYDEIAE